MAQTWDDTLRASGYRVTPQRQLVLEAVTKLEHATPEEIFADIHQTARGVNVSTVYRTLETLTEQEFERAAEHTLDAYDRESGKLVKKVALSERPSNIAEIECFMGTRILNMSWRGLCVPLLAVLFSRAEAQAATVTVHVGPGGSMTFSPDYVAIALGDNFFLRGRYQDAAVQYELALSLAPGRPDILIRLERLRPFLAPVVIVDPFPPPVFFSTLMSSLERGISNSWAFLSSFKASSNRRTFFKYELYHWWAVAYSGFRLIARLYSISASPHRHEYWFIKPSDACASASESSS
jgi:hypothetical protein